MTGKKIPLSGGNQETASQNILDVNNTIFLPKYDWQKVLNHLLNIGSALSIDLEKEYAIRYAPSVIQTIEKNGISIASANEPYLRRDGKTSQLARYSIAEGWQDRARALLGVV